MTSIEELTEKLERFGADALAWKARALIAEKRCAKALAALQSGRLSRFAEIRAGEIARAEDILRGKLDASPPPPE